jgi:hypothetical protein
LAGRQYVHLRLVGGTILFSLAAVSTAASASSADNKPPVWKEEDTVKMTPALAAPEMFSPLPDDPDEFFSGRYPGTYSGLVDAGNETFDLLVTSTTSAEYSELVDDLSERAAKIRSIELVKYSYAELQSARDLISGELTEVRASGVKITLLGIDLLENRVFVGLSGAPAAFKEGRVPAIADDPIYRFSEIGTINLHSRYDDSNPFWGGSAIQVGPGGADCTSGFNVVIGGVAKLTTAGHCVFEGGSGLVYTGGGTYIGTTSIWTFANGANLDAAIVVPQNYQVAASVIYTGQVAARQVAGSQRVYQPSTSYNKCLAGRFTNETCNLRLFGAGWSVPVQPGITQTLDVYQSLTSVGTFGDSGGPVYSLTGAGKAVAWGIFQGKYSGNPTLLSVSRTKNVIDWSAASGVCCS